MQRCPADRGMMTAMIRPATPADRPARTSSLQPDHADAPGTGESARMPLFDWVLTNECY